MKPLFFTLYITPCARVLKIVKCLKILVPASVTGGVADHARLLARHLSFNTHVIEISEHSIATLAVGAKDGVLLSYSGYGYHKHGAPLWLANWVGKFSNSAKLFGTYFHELYATSPPWQRAFWFSAAQKKVAIRLAQSSAFILTSRSRYWSWLQGVAGTKPHLIAPVFSNVGEISQRSTWVGTQAVVFGSVPVRAALYSRYLASLEQWSKSAGIVIHDIGDPVSADMSDRLRKAGVELHGRLSEQEVSHRLQCAGWGLLAYEPAFLAKSSVFAAYAAHGLCPVVMSARGASEDGVRPGVHYLGPYDLHSSDSGCAPSLVADRAYEWYCAHSVARQAAAIEALINDLSHPEMKA